MNRIKDERQKNGLSQQALAKKIGVSYRTIQNWENGVNQIKPDKAEQLADYFGVSVGYLLGYSDFVSQDDFIATVEKTDFFDDGDFKNYSDKVFFRDYNLSLGFALLQHYHGEMESLLSYILGAYIQKDVDKILTRDDLSQIPALLTFLEKQSSEVTEGGSLLKEVLFMIQQKYKT